MTLTQAVRATALAAAAVFLSLQGAGFGQPGGTVDSAQSVPKKARVAVKDNYFEPRSVEVLEGSEVQWKWRGMNRHSIRFTKVPGDASRKGAKTRADGRWKRRFHRPGVYRYVCKVWSGMRGSITVRPEPEPEPEPTP